MIFTRCDLISSIIIIYILYFPPFLSEMSGAEIPCIGNSRGEIVYIGKIGGDILYLGLLGGKLLT